MWNQGWRERIWTSLDQPWDLIIIGGGITGAGILREAARAGLRALLVEAGDFASGTSSRSSKLVHGGFRYLKNAQLKLTLESVRERERLLAEGRGLINQLGFLLASYHGDSLPTWVFGAGLTLYDLLAWQWTHRYYDALDIKELCPPINQEKLAGGYRYFDAQTDDARLVLRLLQESVSAGGTAINYAQVPLLLRRQTHRVCGVVLQDQVQDPVQPTQEIQARVVINATGAWADQLRCQVGGRSQLRQLRGSHLVLPAGRLPLTRAVSFLHPVDRRPVFAIPWEGVTLVGTTDVDYPSEIQRDPAVSPSEVDYLLAALERVFPSLALTAQDVQATFSGIRAVINTGKSDPSQESRDHILWQESGLLTITGGKLTTFRLMAHDALESIRNVLPGRPRFDPHSRVLDIPPKEEILDDELPGAARQRLLGRYGKEAPALLKAALPGELEPCGGTSTLWAELRWAARSEGVIHLDDLLLRRVRLGLTLPGGGLQHLALIRQIAQTELSWTDEHWYQEVKNYRALWEGSYQIPQ